MVYKTAVAKMQYYDDVEYTMPHYETVTELIRALPDDEILCHVNFSLKLSQRAEAVAAAMR